MSKRPTAQEPSASYQDILKAINGFADEMEGRFVNVNEQFDYLKKNLKERFNDLEDDLTTVKQEQTRQDVVLFEIKTALFKMNSRLQVLPTKDYLDEKIGSVRGDITGKQKNTYEALKKVVKILERKKVVEPDEAKTILKLVEFQPE